MAALPLAQLLETAITAAREAGGYIAGLRGRELAVGDKGGAGSAASRVLTEADLGSQAIILRHLEPTLQEYDLALLSEERPDDGFRLAREAFWCVDPMDGTLAFTEGTPGYAVSIALVSRAGAPLLGVVFDPVTGVLYHGLIGKGAFRNGEPWRVPEPDSDAALLWLYDRSFSGDARIGSLREALGVLTRRAGYAALREEEEGGAVMHALAVVERAPALYLKPPREAPGGGSLWDFAATACIVREAGGVATAYNGAPLPLNQPDALTLHRSGVLFASSAALAENVRSGT